MDSSTAPGTPVPATAASSSSSDDWILSHPEYIRHVPAPVVGSSILLEAKTSPFYVHKPDPNHKYKYPEANPTPVGEDETTWGKIYTAADSRKYNKNHKNHVESKKFRVSGETYTLALDMLVEKKIRYGKAVKLAIAAGLPIPTEIPRGDPKDAAKPTPVTKPEPRGHAKSHMIPDALVGGEALSISEKIKSQARVRTPSSFSTTSSSIAKTTELEMGSTKKTNATPRPKGDKGGNKRSSEASVKATSKKTKLEDTSSASSDQSVVPPPPVMTKAASDAMRKAKGTEGYKTPWAKNDNGKNEEGKDIYCMCRKISTEKQTMVQCDSCDEWFHAACVGFDEHTARIIVDKYFCSICTTETQFTNFRKLCRYGSIHRKLDKSVPECHMPALVNIDSKYCSVEHGIKYWDWVVKYGLRSDSEPSRGGKLNQEEFANMIKSCKTIQEFHKLGQKPALKMVPSLDTPELRNHLPPWPYSSLHPEETVIRTQRHIGSFYINMDEACMIKSLNKRTIEAQNRIDLFKKMLKFVDLVNNRANLAVDYIHVIQNHRHGDRPTLCGYDNRLGMNEEQFKEYLETDEGNYYFNPRPSGVIRLGPMSKETKALLQIEPTPDEEDYPKLTCAFHELLQDLCCATSSVHHKNKKTCKHVGWRTTHPNWVKDQIYSLKEEIKMYNTECLQIYGEAEIRELLVPYYGDNITEDMMQTEPFPRPRNLQIGGQIKKLHEYHQKQLSSSGLAVLHPLIGPNRKSDEN